MLSSTFNASGTPDSAAARGRLTDRRPTFLSGAVPYLGHTERPLSLLARGNKDVGDVFAIQLRELTARAVCVLGPEARELLTGNARFELAAALASDHRNPQLFALDNARKPRLFWPGDVELPDDLIAPRRLRHLPEQAAGATNDWLDKLGQRGAISVADLARTLSYDVAARLAIGTSETQVLEILRRGIGKRGRLSKPLPGAPWRDLRALSQASSRAMALVRFLQQLVTCRGLDEGSRGALAAFALLTRYLERALGSVLEEIGRGNLVPELLVEQDRVIEDQGDLTYELLAHLHLLWGVLLESERLHPSFPLLALRLRRNYQLPFSRYQLRRGEQLVFCSTLAHRDARLWPQPGAFIPSRFLQPATPPSGSAVPPALDLPLTPHPHLLYSHSGCRLLRELAAPVLLTIASTLLQRLELSTPFSMALAFRKRSI